MARDNSEITMSDIVCTLHFLNDPYKGRIWRAVEIYDELNSRHSNRHRFCEPGTRHYGLEKKKEVVKTYRMLRRRFGRKPTLHEVADVTEVSTCYVHKVLLEWKLTGKLSDPEEGPQPVRTVANPLTAEEELFLLSLHAQDESRSIESYQRKLCQHCGTKVPSSTITDWLSKWFDTRGNVRHVSLVPMDKFTPQKIERWQEFRDTINRLHNPFKYHWLDKKDLVSENISQGHVRAADTITGRRSTILVPGAGFQEVNSLIAIIYCDYNRSHPLEFLQGNDDENLLFRFFISHLISKNWFQRGDFVIIDKAAIGNDKNAEFVEDLLWDHIQEDGQPLNVSVIYQPTRSPELNPIELVFHVFAQRIRKWRRSANDAIHDDMNSIFYAISRILRGLDFELVMQCAAHCGY